MELDNPVLSELDSLSPHAKSALAQAHGKLLTLNSGGAPLGPAPDAGAADAPKLQPLGNPSEQPPSAPGMLPTIGGAQQPQQSPGMLPTLAQPSAQVDADRTELNRKITSGSGVSQIHNPFLKTLGVIGDAVGTGLFPRIAAQIPGTTAHHQQLIGADAARLKADEGVETEAAKNQETAAQANQYNAHADSLENPAENVQPITTDEGIYGLNRKTGGVNPLSAPGGEPLKPPAKPKTLQHIETDQGIFSLDPSTGALTPLTFNGQPLKGKQPRDAANKTVQLEIGGKPHTVMVDDSGNVVKDLGATGEKPPTVNVNANTSALDRESSRFAKTHEKSVSDADAQLEKIADARAMVNGNAESQALGIPKVLTALVSGAGSGVRITQPELNAIAKARGVQGDFEGFVNKISGKGSLTAQQQQQLTQILDDVHTRILTKRGIASDALDAINGAGSRDEVIKADKIARQKLTDIATSGGANTHTSGDEMITVQVPGHQPGQIHASQKAQFLKDFPNAVFPKGR